MAIQLRDYQDNIVGEVRSAYREGYTCPLVVASTGAGKTIIFSYITHGAAAKDNAALLTAHRKEIIRQISLSLAKFGVEHQVVAPAPIVQAIKIAHFRAFGRVFVNQGSPIMVGSVQTVAARFDQVERTLKTLQAKLGKKPKMLVVMDEGHHVVENTTWGKVMDRFMGDEWEALGLIVTASPERLDGRGLGKGHGGYADVLIEGPPMKWLIENGYLSPYRIFATGKPIDLAGVRIKMGEYATADLQERVDKPKITGDAIKHYRDVADGTRAVVFCVSIEHSKHVAEEFNRAGIPTAHIDGGLDDASRDKAIMDFADGKIMVLTQVNLISEGFDLAAIAQKDVTIDTLIDLAPTNSLVNAMQRWGRVLRPYPGKVAIILDHAGNVGSINNGTWTTRHGLPDTPREWTLEGRKKKKRKPKEGEEEAPVDVRTCPKCFCIHGLDPMCPNCGHVYPIKERKIEVEEGHLQELEHQDKEAINRQKKREVSQARTLDELRALAAKRGYKPSWADHIWKARQAKAGQTANYY